MATTVGGGFVYTSIVGPQGLDSVSGSGPPSPVLLPNLVAGWALTAGPQQTLDSTGVISGGALDLTAHPVVSYGSKGLDNTAGSGYLSHAYDPVFHPGSNSLLIVAIIEHATLPPPGREIYIAQADGGVNDEYVLDSSNDISNFWPDFYIGSSGNSAVDSSSTPFVVNTPMMVSALFNSGAQELSMRVNDGTPVVITGTGALTTTNVNPFTIASDNTGSNALVGFIKYVRLWIGPNAVTVANNSTWMTWLYNSGAGRSDAEVAAYTG